MKAIHIRRKIQLSLMVIVLSMFSLSVIGHPLVNTNTDGKRQYRYSDNFSSYDVQVKGEVKVTDDDTGIKSISPYGYLKISKKTFGNKRAIIIESDQSGQLSYEYYEGRKEIPFEDEGRKWLADILLDVVRLTGIDAEGRVDRIYKKKGFNGVLDEIQAIPSNSTMAIYFETLLDNHSLSEDELISTAYAISTEMSSNSQSGRLFREYGSRFTQNNRTSVAYFNSVAKLSSNSERASILRAIDTKIDFSDTKVIESYFSGLDKMSSNSSAGSVLRYVNKTQDLSDEAYVRLLQSVKKLSSNTEMGSVMRSLHSLKINKAEVGNAFFNAIDVMSSNTEAASTLRFALKQYELSDENYVRLLGSVKKLSSNTEMGSVMRRMPGLEFEKTAMVDAYFIAITSMSSNSEAGSVLRHAMKNHSMTDYAWSSLFNATTKLTSNTEMGQVLSTAIDQMPFEDQTLDAFFATADHFSSSTEHGRILRKMLKSSKLNVYACIGTLRSARKISSNTEKASVLVLLAETDFVSNSRIKEDYKATAKTLSSDSEYRRVIEKLID